MGATELRPSFAPRSQMNNTFLPFSPMLPSARARFMTKGMSVRVDKATAMLALNERSKNVRRVMRLRLPFCIQLLLLKSLRRHQHGNHAPHAGVIVRRCVGQGAEGRRGAVVRRVEETDG